MPVAKLFAKLLELSPLDVVVACPLFSTLDDMFNFFKTGDLSINPHYWMEKLEAGMHRGSNLAMEFSTDAFRKFVKNEVEYQLEETQNITRSDDR